MTFRYTFVSTSMLRVCADVYGGGEGHDDVSVYSYQVAIHTEPDQHSSQRGHPLALSSISFLRRSAIHCWKIFAF